MRDTADLIDQVVLPELATAGFRTGDCTVLLTAHGKICPTRCEIQSRQGSPAELVRKLARRPDVTAVKWVPLEHQ
jgi:hypothetical protein